MAADQKLAGLSWGALLRALWRGGTKANIPNRAAELAFWFLLGFFPMLLSVVSMVSMIGSAPDSQAILMKSVGEVLPPAASNLVQQVLAQTRAQASSVACLAFRAMVFLIGDLRTDRYSQRNL